MTGKVVSLGAELAVLARAVQGVANFLDVGEIGNLPEEQKREAVAMLAVIASRVVQLRRSVIGAQDPKTLLAPHNGAEEPRRGDDPDILLRPWPDASRARLRKRAKAK
jgi:hypothetical protein